MNKKKIALELEFLPEIELKLLINLLIKFYVQN